MEHQLIRYHKELCRATGQLVTIIIKRKATKRALLDVCSIVRHATADFERYLQENL